MEEKESRDADDHYTGEPFHRDGSSGQGGGPGCVRGCGRPIDGGGQGQGRDLPFVLDEARLLRRRFGQRAEQLFAKGLAGALEALTGGGMRDSQKPRDVREFEPAEVVERKHVTGRLGESFDFAPDYRADFTGF